MGIDYTNFRMTLRNLDDQHEHLLNLSPEYPYFVQEAMSESVIQRYEVCYDSLWKVLRRYLVEELGIADAPTAPKPIFRVADANHLLAAGCEQWFTYVQTRIDTTHDYDGEKAAQAIDMISRFIPDAIRLYEEMTGEIWK